MKYGFGVDVGGTTVKLAYFTENGDMLAKWEIPTVTENGGTQILPDIAASIADYLEKNGISKADVLGVGLAVPGPVNEMGVVDQCVNLGWGVTPVARELGALIGLPVKTGNDASVAALGECWKGGGAGFQNMILATLGTGVGGGIVLGGRVLNGAHGAAGEIGHIPLEPEETELCGCGKRGCVEQYCSATGVVRLAKRKLAGTDCPSVLREKEPLTCKDVFDAGAAGDELAQAVLEQVYDYMGRFLAAAACTVDPEAIVLGGGVSRAGKPLLEGARRAYEKYAFHASRQTAFRLATLGNDAGAFGAFKLLLD